MKLHRTGFACFLQIILIIMGDEKMDYENESRQFDKAADYYDKYRPGYPEKIFDDMILISGINNETAKILEIGCGSGKATEYLANRGFTVTGIDIGENLIRQAKENFKEYKNITFIKDKFEDAEFKANSFDMVFSAQAFHWVEQPVGYYKSAKILKPEGTLSLLWNMYITFDNEVDNSLLALSKKYGGFADFLSEKACKTRINDICSEIEQSGYFEKPVVKTVLWEQKYTVDEYFGFVMTGNKFIQKEEDEQKRAYNEIKILCEKHGGYIVRPYLSALYVSRKKL